MSYTTTSTKHYSKVAGRVLLFAMIGFGINLMVPLAPVALTVNFICIWHLYKTAERYAASGVEGFDATVAAEAIVGFGILCLVLGLSSVALLFAIGRLEVESVSGRLDLAGGIPFIEGLFTAGVTPFFAILLRMKVAELGDMVDPADDMASLSRAAASLTRTLTNAHAALGEFQSGATAAATSTTNLATVMDTGVARIETEVGRMGTALRDGGKSVSEFGSSSESASTEIAALGDHATKLKLAVADTTNLLEELGRVIVSVQRFVEPAARSPS